MTRKLEMYKGISVVISTKEIKPEYIEHVKKTCGNPSIEVIAYVNNGSKSLAETYNQGLTDAKNEIVVFCHDDLIFNTSGWGSKLLKHFNGNSEYGIIGVAGTDLLTNGCWWNDRKKMYGVVNHIHNGKKHTNHYSEGFGSRIKQTVVVDGLFIATCRERLKRRFNEQFHGFHFYDIPFCLENHLQGVKVGIVTDIRLTHLSIGMIGEAWVKNLKLFDKIYADKLPCEITTLK